MRTPIPPDISAQVMYEHDRTCCVCNEPGKAVQIHHIDEDPSNHAPENLAVLCLQHHEETQVRGGFGKKLRDVDIRKHRDEWVRRVHERRGMADKLAIKRTTSAQPSQKIGIEYRGSAKVLEVYLNQIPQILHETYAQVGNMSAGGDSKDAVAAARLVASVLEKILVQLSQWVDPYHFDGKSPRDFYSELLANLNKWNRILVEPKDYGWRARTGTIETLEGTLIDLRQAINRLVLALGKAYLADFNFAEWVHKNPSIRLWTKAI